jgi:hypothetical protein
MMSTSGGGELDTLGVGRYPVAGVDGQGVVTAVERNAFVESVLNDVAEVGISDAESRSSGRSTSITHGHRQSHFCIHEIRIE